MTEEHSLNGLHGSENIGDSFISRLIVDWILFVSPPCLFEKCILLPSSTMFPLVDKAMQKQEVVGDERSKCEVAEDQ